LGNLFAGKPHELPAPAAGSIGHDRRRPRGIAELPVDRIPDPRLAGNDVDDQPVEEEAEVGHGRAEVAADQAVGPVTADDPAGSDLARLSVGIRHHELDVAARGPDVDHLAGASNLHTRWPSRMASVWPTGP